MGKESGPINICLFTLLKLMIIRKQIGRHMDALRGEDYSEVALKIYSSSGQTDYLKKIFSEGDGAKLFYKDDTLKRLVSFLNPDFDYKDFEEFCIAHDSKMVRKYYDPTRLHRYKGEFSEKELNEIYSWAHGRCKELFDEKPKPKDPDPDPDPDSEDSLPLKYLKRKIADFEFISLPFAEDETKIPIAEISVPYLQQIINIKDAYKDGPDKSVKNIKPHELIDTNDHILAIAEGGAGKTTLCKWLFKHFAERIILKNDFIFPIYIELDGVNSLKEAFAGEIADLTKLEELLKTYVPLIIFDGLDEVRPEHTELMQELVKFANQFKGWKVFVTSRESDHINDFISLGFPLFRFDNYSTDFLPGLMMKNDPVLLESFHQYEKTSPLRYQVKGNFFLYTALIHLYKKHKGNPVILTQGKILQEIIENDLFAKWELAKAKDRAFFVKHGIDISEIMDTLSVTAIVVALTHLFCMGNRRGIAYLNKSVVWGREGFTRYCLKNLIKECVPDEIADHMLDLFSASGILLVGKNKNYRFGNKVIHNYFFARGIHLLLFTTEKLVFDNKIVYWIRRYFSENRQDFASELVAGLIAEPSEWVKKMDFTIPKEKYWQLHFKQRHVQKLFFAATLIGIRGKEIDHEDQERIINQILYLVNTLVFEKDSKWFYKISMVRGAISISNRDHTMDTSDHMHILLQTKHPLVFETVFKIFRNKQKSHFLYVWDYFSLFPDNKDLYLYCLSLFEKGTLTFEECEYPTEILDYLHQFHADKLIPIYITVFTNPSAFSETILKKGNTRSIGRENIEKLWQYIVKESSNNPKIEGLAEELANAILLQTQLSNNEELLNLGRDFMLACGARLVNKLFFIKIALLIEKATSEDDALLLLSALRDCASISSEDLQTYGEFIDSVMEKNNKQITDKLLSCFCIFLNRGNKSPDALFAHLKSGLKSEDIDLNYFSLFYLKFFQSTVLAEEEIKLLPSFLNSDEVMIRESTAKLLIKWELKEYKQVLFDYVYHSNKEMSFEVRAGMFEFLIDEDIGIYYVLTKINPFEKGVINTMLTLTMAEDKFEDYFKLNPGTGSVYSRYRDLLLSLKGLGTEFSIPFLIYFQTYFKEKKNGLDRIVVNVMDHIQRRAEKFNLFAKKNPLRIKTFQEAIDKTTYADEKKYFGIEYYYTMKDKM